MIDNAIPLNPNNRSTYKSVDALRQGCKIAAEMMPARSRTWVICYIEDAPTGPIVTLALNDGPVRAGAMCCFEATGMDYSHMFLELLCAIAENAIDMAYTARAEEVIG